MTALRPEDVADEMGLSPTQIRNLMRLNRFKPAIGYVYRTAGNRHSYVIYRPMLDEYLHKRQEQRIDLTVLAETVDAMRKENDKLAALVASILTENAALKELLGQVIRKEVNG